MASTYTPLGIEKMATGENAGTWGTKTNTNLEIIEQISGGYTAVNFGSDADIALSVSDGSTGAALAHRVLEFTSSGSLTATRNCTIPLDVQQFYILKNSTTGSQSITFKYVSGSGDSITIANGDTVIAYAKADDGTNPNIASVAIGDVTLTGTQTLTNKTLISLAICFLCSFVVVAPDFFKPFTAALIPAVSNPPNNNFFTPPPSLYPNFLNLTFL